MTDPQDMEAARACVPLFSFDHPVDEAAAVQRVATAIAQARVDAERERDEVRADYEARHLAIREHWDALAAQVEAHRVYADERVAHFKRIGKHLTSEGMSMFAEAMRFQDVVSATPAASLIAHDNALIERCAALAKASNFVDGPLGTIEGQIAEDIRALKTDSEWSTT